MLKPSATIRKRLPLLLFGPGNLESYLFGTKHSQFPHLQMKIGKNCFSKESKINSAVAGKKEKCRLAKILLNTLHTAINSYELLSHSKL